MSRILKLIITYSLLFAVAASSVNADVFDCCRVFAHGDTNSSDEHFDKCARLAASLDADSDEQPLNEDGNHNDKDNSEGCGACACLCHSADLIVVQIIVSPSEEEEITFFEDGGFLSYQSFDIYRPPRAGVC